ncbi:hypothetical protein DENSPDRAFT_853978 [Dentipellis sp. KUC8613]|nr:hypothetical protein DENSPDRAFT_853978 [Dentipellis sp. KUC8613]
MAAYAPGPALFTVKCKSSRLRRAGQRWQIHVEQECCGGAGTGARAKIGVVAEHSNLVLCVTTATRIAITASPPLDITESTRDTEIQKAAAGDHGGDLEIWAARADICIQSSIWMSNSNAPRTSRIRNTQYIHLEVAYTDASTMGIGMRRDDAMRGDRHTQQQEATGNQLIRVELQWTGSTRAANKQESKGRQQQAQNPSDFSQSKRKIMHLRFVGYRVRKNRRLASAQQRSVARPPREERAVRGDRELEEHDGLAARARADRRLRGRGRGRAGLALRAREAHGREEAGLGRGRGGRLRGDGVLGGARLLSGHRLDSGAEHCWV